jgi:hypothetical protein
MSTYPLRARAGIAIGSVIVIGLVCYLHPLVTIEHAIAAGIPVGIFILIAVNPDQAKSDARLRGAMMCAFVSGGVIVKLDIATILVFALNYGALGWLVGDYIDSHRSSRIPEEP